MVPVITTPAVRWVTGRRSDGDAPGRRIVAMVHEPVRRESGGWAADIRCARFVHASGRMRISGADAAQALELALSTVLALYARCGVRDIHVACREPGTVEQLLDEDEYDEASAWRIDFTTPPVRRISGWYRGDDGAAERVRSTVHAPKPIAGYGFAADIRCPRFIISSGTTRTFGVDYAHGVQLAAWFIVSNYIHYGVHDIVIAAENPDAPPL